jgi:hypothetical protein
MPERLAPVISEEGVDAYWARVGANLASGRLRLIFVADEIPAELKRIIEFLNEQMRPTEVLGVEVKPSGDCSSAWKSAVSGEILGGRCRRRGSKVSSAGPSSPSRPTLRRPLLDAGRRYQRVWRCCRADRPP